MRDCGARVNEIAIRVNREMEKIHGFTLRDQSKCQLSQNANDSVPVQIHRVSSLGLRRMLRLAKR